MRFTRRERRLLQALGLLLLWLLLFQTVLEPGLQRTADLRAQTRDIQSRERERQRTDARQKEAWAGTGDPTQRFLRNVEEKQIDEELRRAAEEAGAELTGMAIQKEEALEAGGGENALLVRRPIVLTISCRDSRELEGLSRRLEESRLLLSVQSVELDRGEDGRLAGSMELSCCYIREEDI